MLDLRNNSAEEIADAILELPIEKGSLLLNIIAKRFEKITQRAELVARRKSHDDFEKYLEEGER